MASYRSEDASSALVAALRDAHARDGGDVEVHEIEVGALDSNEARDLAMTLLGGDAPASRAQAAVIAEESRGSPFFIEELVRHATTGRSLEWSAVGPTLRLEDVLYARVSELPEDARRLLDIIAVAGKPLSRLAAASAADLEGEREITALAVLRTARLLRSLRTQDQYDVETYHDRIRETVVGRLDAASRAALHLRVAHALAARGNADPEALAVHFREGGELRKAAEFAALAAAKAVEALAFDRAAVLWRGALELPNIAPEIARDRRWKLGDALANAGRGAEAAEAYLAATEGASASDRLELRRRAADQLLRCGRIAEGLRAIEHVLAAVGMKLPTAPWLILLSLLFQGLLLRIRGLGFRSRDASELSATELMRIDILWSVRASLAVVRPILAKVFQRKHLLLALRAGEPTRIARGLAVETSSAFGGVPVRRRTETLLRATRALAERVADPYSLAWAVAADGITAYLEGRFSHAFEQCDRAAQQFRERCNGANWENASLVLLGSQAVFHVGAMAELSRRMPMHAQDARQRGDLYLLTNVRLGWMNSVWLAADDADRAERELAEAMTQWGSPEQQLQQYYELLARVQIDLYRGRGLEAHALIEARWRAMAQAHVFRIQTVRVFVHHLRARAALGAIAAGEVTGAAADALAASALRDARKIEREHLRWATPLAQLIDAAVQARRGDRARAIELLTSAADDFAACDMALWSATAKRTRGVLMGDEEGRVIVATADSVCRGQGVREPARFSTMLAPGFAAR